MRTASSLDQPPKAAADHRAQRAGRYSRILERLLGLHTRSRRTISEHRQRRKLRDREVSDRSRRGLDWTNFFLADVQMSFGSLGGFARPAIGGSRRICINGRGDHRGRRAAVGLLAGNQAREIRRLMCCNPTSPALHENDDKAQAELYGQMTSSRSAQTRSRSRRRAEHNPLSRAGREVYAARRLSLLSAMAVSFLSAAFSSSRFC